ncbi:hypothetical protein LRAMOSA09879 [Lichtheimia ramosa]|uniref:Uncharacterized protein n=1 Tax=Lichtheimia ramosa TaxID=688394 RepID=A0A077WN33_9FUNG|nr:hypothetical protein LRAMOSA09879 [Lichtheimia ramosa]
MYMSQAKFEAALRDAHAMCDIDPQSPLGYLCVGEVYRQQGRQQKAIDIYSLALKKAPTQHPSYSSLIQAKEDATSQLEKRVDFISQLPFEIVNQYIIPIILEHQPWTMYNQWPYLHISQTWRDRLLQSASLHYQLDDNLNDKVAYENQVDKFKDYIHTITWHPVRGDNGLQAFPWQSAKSLKGLELYYDFLHKGQQPADLLPLLTTLGDRLTHLKLSMCLDDRHNIISDTQRPIHLERILEHAPHLRMLTVVRVIVNEWNSSNTYPNLINLAIHAPPDPMAHSNVISVLEHCPSLQALSMYGCDQSHSLRVIHDYCPKLSYLRYGPSRDIYDDSCLDFDSYNFDSNTIPGLTKLHVVAIYTLYDISDVISLLQQHHSTLEEITIIASIDETAMDEKDMNISFPQLKSLHLEGACTQSQHMFNWILEHAPNLRSLGLVTPCTTIADPVSNHITTLTMTIVDDMHYQFLDRFVSHHFNLGKHSCLKHLSLIFTSGVTGYEAMVQNIGDLIQLDTLSIDIYDVGYSNAFNIMLQKFVSRDHLFSSLSWKGDGDRLTQSLQYIQRMNHINDLTLGRKLSESDVLCVSFCNPQRSLTVESVYKIPDQALDMLRERFKKIRLSIDYMN